MEHRSEPSLTDLYPEDTGLNRQREKVLPPDPPALRQP